MFYDPGTVFTIKDAAGARRLNHVLNWLPRYRTDGRFNAGLVNRVTRVGRHLLPTPADIDVTVTTLSVGNDKLSIRILSPTTPRALLLHFHGGAWVIGDSKIDDYWNAEYVRRCGIAVASADFHLATDDNLARTIMHAHAFTEWALDSLPDFGVDKLLLEGESSGAHLAASSLTHLSRSRPIESVVGFISFCGAFDFAGPASLRTASDSLVIDPPAAARNLDRLLDGSPSLSIDDPAVSPLLADLREMPPALFIGGALDPIVGDSQALHAAWSSGAGNADLLIVPEGPHGFERFPTRLAARTKTVVVEWINRRIRNDRREASFDADIKED